MIKRILLVAVVPVIFSSCLSPKVDKWIGQHYESTLPAQIRNNRDYISINTKGVTKENTVSSTIKGNRKVVPALLYWQWDLSNISTLHQYVPLSNFNSSMLTYANSKGLRQKLKEGKIEITLDKVPAVFSVRDKGGMVFFIIWYVGWEKIFIQPEAQDLVATYRVLKDDNEIKNERSRSPTRDQPVSQKIFQATRKMTWNYLDQYDNNIRLMGRQFMDQLIEQLQE